MDDQICTQECIRSSALIYRTFRKHTRRIYFLAKSCTIINFGLSLFSLNVRNVRIVRNVIFPEKDNRNINYGLYPIPPHIGAPFFHSSNVNIGLTNCTDPM